MKKLKGVVVREEDLNYLAGQFMEVFCIEGVRNRGGRYTRIGQDAQLMRRVKDAIRERLFVILEEQKQQAHKTNTLRADEQKAYEADLAREERSGKPEGF